MSNAPLFSTLQLAHGQTSRAANRAPGHAGWASASHPPHAAQRRAAASFVSVHAAHDHAPGAACRGCMREPSPRWSCDAASHSRHQEPAAQRSRSGSRLSQLATRGRCGKRDECGTMSHIVPHRRIHRIRNNCVRIWEKIALRSSSSSSLTRGASWCQLHSLLQGATRRRGVEQPAAAGVRPAGAGSRLTTMLAAHSNFVAGCSCNDARPRRRRRDDCLPVQPEL